MCKTVRHMYTMRYAIYVLACLLALHALAAFLFVRALVQSRKKDFQSDLSTSIGSKSVTQFTEKHPYSVIVFHLTLNCDQEIKRNFPCAFSPSRWNILCFFFSSQRISTIFKHKQQSAKHLYSVIACSHHHANVLCSMCWFSVFWYTNVYTTHSLCTYVCFRGKYTICSTPLGAM